MAKCSDYKVNKVYMLDDGNYTEIGTNVIDALCYAKKKKVPVYAAFEMKRRQTIDTWVSQLSKYVGANRSKLGDFIDALHIEPAGNYVNDEGVTETLVKLYT